MIMNFCEPEYISMLRESIRRFLDREATREQMAAWDEADKVPRELFDKICTLGVTGMTIPEEYGGTGRDILARWSSLKNSRGDPWL